MLVITNAVFLSIAAEIKTQTVGDFVLGLSFLLQAKSREVVQAGLGLLKVLLTVFPDTSLAQHLSQLVSRSASYI